MLEAIHAFPSGDSTVARFAATAAEYGYDGIVVRNPPGDQPAYDPGEIHEAYGIDVVRGVELHGDDRATVSGYLGSVRREATIVLVRGGTPALNRFAVRQSRVDVLTNPTGGSGAIDHVMVRTAKEHGVRIAFDLGSVLRSQGGRRVRAIQALRELRRFVVKYDAPFVVSAGPTSHLHLRAPRELGALGETIGFDVDAIRDGLGEWARIAERNRERLSDSYVENGVSVTRSTTDQ